MQKQYERQHASVRYDEGAPSRTELRRKDGGTPCKRSGGWHIAAKISVSPRGHESFLSPRKTLQSVVAHQVAKHVKILDLDVVATRGAERRSRLRIHVLQDDDSRVKAPTDRMMFTCGARAAESGDGTTGSG